MRVIKTGKRLVAQEEAPYDWRPSKMDIPKQSPLGHSPNSSSLFSKEFTEIKSAYDKFQGSLRSIYISAKENDINSFKGALQSCLTNGGLNDVIIPSLKRIAMNSGGVMSEKTAQLGDNPMQSPKIPQQKLHGPGYVDQASQIAMDNSLVKKYSSEFDALKLAYNSWTRVWDFLSKTAQGRNIQELNRLSNAGVSACVKMANVLEDMLNKQDEGSSNVADW